MYDDGLSKVWNVHEYVNSLNSLFALRTSLESSHQVVVAATAMVAAWETPDLELVVGHQSSKFPNDSCCMQVAMMEALVAALVLLEALETKEVVLAGKALAEWEGGTEVDMEVTLGIWAVVEEVLGDVWSFLSPTFPRSWQTRPTFSTWWACMGMF